MECKGSQTLTGQKTHDYMQQKAATNRLGVALGRLLKVRHERTSRSGTNSLGGFCIEGTLLVLQVIDTT